tara:strand:- start:568 stop:996 length:429 start_codon:yes stop_codon:yes gene_type:complete
MPFKFNKTLWELGRQIEDETLPELNEYFNCNFERNDNDIFDVFDFKDPDKNIIVEVKGRRCPSTEYEETIITASKVTSGYQAIEGGCKVYFVFAFTDKIMYIELKEDSTFKCKFTGTNCIRHYLIPIKDLKDLKQQEDPVPE